MFVSTYVKWFRCIDRYHFDDETAKESSLAELHVLIAEGHVLYRKLQKQELESGNYFFSGINQNWNPITHQDSTSPKKDDGAFKLGKGRKKGRSPTPPDDASTKKLKTFEVETTNKHNALDLPQSQPENEDDTQVNAGSHNVVRAAPPITIDNVHQSNQLLKKLQDITKQKLRGRIIGKGLSLPRNPRSVSCHQTLRRSRKVGGLHVPIQRREIIESGYSGMPSDTPPQDIIDKLLTFGISVNECHAMTNRKTGQPMPLFLVTPRNEINRNIFNLTDLCYLKIIVEPLRPKFGPAQCFRCQGFFHSSKFCTRNPKCGLPHLTKDCTKSSNTEATCCDCQGNHPANFTGCPRNPLNKPPPPPKVNYFEKEPGNAENRKRQPKAKHLEQSPVLQSQQEIPLPHQ
ncbi:RNA-directed DNA polymerase from mobile element jockey [Trichonephila inaurata madagascariensis]|uniref:RNA-directed DNA polymerase from mobile element jockey n=1 Tax=Trichonephila inaurata madagascariensis TaxID=2747483 RepID=A0A8X6Y4U2_9ARAC|nr:RNA-directed DNA polymerase from mobile element jockey [Trichonephila inaurata madagascariensis]